MTKLGMIFAGGVIAALGACGGRVVLQAETEAAESPMISGTADGNERILAALRLTGSKSTRHPPTSAKSGRREPDVPSLNPEREARLQPISHHAER